MKRNFIKILDNVNTGLLTMNKLIQASKNFTGPQFNSFMNDNKINNKKPNLDEVKDNYNKKSEQHTIKSFIQSQNIEEKVIIKEKYKEVFEKNDDKKLRDNSSIKDINQNKAIKEEPKISEIIPKRKKSIEKDDFIEPTLIKSDKLKFLGKETKLPVSSFSRAMNFGFLGASIITNSIGNVILDRVTFKDPQASYSKYLVNETNAEKLSRTLCRMRGAALKLGQILSTFEDIIIPEPIKFALEKARAEADVMPNSQLMKILKNEYGKNWKEKFHSFDEKPFAAASIGQVHFAVSKNNERMAIKIQYPGVAQSIDSDLNNLKRIFEYFKIFPKGLFVDDLIKNLGNELKMECDYIQESEKQMKFKELLKSDPFLYIPEIKKEYSSNLIIASEFVEGVNVDELDDYPQSVRDNVGSKILELCLRELFEFNFMQTDPNPANFFYDSKKNSINLIDFGAARYFEKTFVDNYMKIVHAAAINDRHTLLEYSQRIGFLSGKENHVMLDAHAQACLAIGEPFNLQNQDIFDFGNQNLTRKVYRVIPSMLKHRLKAPPTEIYSLHRKLAGAYLICIKLRSRVNSKQMFFDLYDKFYKGRI